MTQQEPDDWVLLIYRLPREPSTPRSSVWRKLRALGVAQLSDGVVALPAGARNRERLEWIAQEVTEAAGEAGLWAARPGSAAQEHRLVAAMTAARTAEYCDLAAAASAAADDDTASRRRTLHRLRRELRRIARRDYFAAAGRDTARATLEELGERDARRDDVATRGGG